MCISHDQEFFVVGFLVRYLVPKAKRNEKVGENPVLRRIFENLLRINTSCDKSVSSKEKQNI